jgi:hypothetical protein
MVRSFELPSSKYEKEWVLHVEREIARARASERDNGREKARKRERGRERESEKARERERARARKRTERERERAREKENRERERRIFSENGSCCVSDHVVNNKKKGNGRESERASDREREIMRVGLGFRV